MLMNLLFSAVLVLGESPSENRAAIQREIDAMAAVGGGRVTIPAGEWVTGSIELKSGVELEDCLPDRGQPKSRNGVRPH